MSNRTTFSVIDFGECPCLGQTLDKFIQPAILTILSPLNLLLKLQLNRETNRGL